MVQLWKIKRFFIYISIFFLLLCSFIAFAQHPSYKIIETQKDLDEVLAEVRQLLIVNFAIGFKWPVSSFLVSAEKLDELYAGIYRGAEVGLYRFVNGRHEVYIMQNIDKDECIGICSHELVHAWQTENCPRDQDLVVKEGFARWIEYKVFDKIGAYPRARSVLETADPVYGVGFKKMLEWEEQLGDVGVVLKARRIKNLSDE